MRQASMAAADARRIATSGRTPEEHEDILRSLESDPEGSRSVRLDFESGDFAGWSVRRLPRDYSAVIQSEVVRTGTKACRFEIRPGDVVSQGLRAELRDWYNAPFEADTWYGFSTFIPQDFSPPKGVGIVLAQWHDQAELGDPAGKPPLAMRYLDGTLRFTGAFSPVASQDPDMRYVFHEIPNVPHGRWLDFVFRIYWSQKGDSTIDAFLKGNSLFRFTGPLGYRNQIKGPYFKLGVYASGDIEGPLVAYHDNYGRADSFEAVDPGVDRYLDKT
ncbi:polysaccharide lyase [Mesorhizobium sp. VNQ89]|uniref:polysaccharide lyase n=1 Tax=Mesorhizobium quangtriensis TaxID=3157709 RepID=UPI0032B7924B